MEFLQDHHALLVPAIFFARVVDVSMGTLRTILVIRGHRPLAATIGFFEVLVWLGAAAAVLQNLDTWYLVGAYAGGFATGNLVGMWLEAKLAIGYELVRAISADPQVRLAECLRAEGHTVIEVPGRAEGRAVEVLLVVERRRRVSELLRRIEKVDPASVCTTSDIRQHRPTSMLPGREPRPGWFGMVKRK